MTTNKAMRRAQRSAQALVKGPEVFDLITSDKVRPLLVKRAERGSPPVTAISKKLVALLGPQLAKKLPVRQFAGVCVRGVLEEEGFEIADTGIRVTGDPMFRTGAVYRRVPKKEA